MYSFSPPKRQICAKNTFGEILVKSSSNPVIQETVAPSPTIAPAISPTIAPAIVDNGDYFKSLANTQAIPNPDMPTQYFNGRQLKTLYNVPNITADDGKKQVKIAIIIAYSYNGEQNAKNDNLGWVAYDLKQYWQNYSNFGPNQSPPKVSVHTMKGATYNKLWGQEECLDVQMVCTINPNANIWVVEAKSRDRGDLLDAVKYAINTIEADVISMSWGSPDSFLTVNKENSSYFTDKTKCFCAGSGDNNQPLWPAVSTNCIAVGGTTLLWTPTNKTPRTEFTWINAGAGYSSTYPIPSYQLAQNNNKNNKKRFIPDVSLIGSNTSMVYIYSSDRGTASNPWSAIYGTSVGTPIFAAVVSIADQLRFNKGKSALTTVYSATPLNPTSSTPPSNNLQNYLYKTILTNSVKYSSDFNDITIGTNTEGGKNSIYNAETGFDIATGIGSPNVAALCNDLLNI